MPSLLLLAVIQMALFFRSFNKRQWCLLTLFLCAYFWFNTLPLVYLGIVNHPQFPSVRDVSKVALLMIPCMLIVYVSYGCIMKWFKIRCVQYPQVKLGLSKSEPLQVSAILFLFLIIPLFIELPNNSYVSVHNIVSQLIVFYFLSNRSKTGLFGIRNRNALLLCSLPVICLIQKGTMEYTLLIVFFIFLSSILTFNRRVLFLLIPILLSGVFIHEVKGVFRREVKENNVETIEKKIGFAAKASREAKEKYLSAIHVIKKSEPSVAVIESTVASVQLSPKVWETLYLKMTAMLLPLTRVVVRLSDTSFHHVVRDTPHTVPFWNGSTYSDALYRFVPGILRSNHALYHAWHDFGLKYRILGVEDRETSVAFNYFTEGYMNFGLPGLIATSIVIGAVLALLQGLFVLPWGSSLQYLIPLVSYRVMDIGQPLTTFLQSTYHAVVLIGAAHVLQSLAMLIWLNYQRWKDSTFESYKYG